ncbi:coenzyme Q-binding protein COQ10 homolog B, mitochondrial [Amblyomma americanum]|uniref:Coenzyme Q-binding protein COQ10 START domain-containing protein n=2 Tax=Amblyomma americanum TaxID=6943 RepID=A0AAQ4FC57_AMBAM
MAALGVLRCSKPCTKLDGFRGLAMVSARNKVPCDAAASHVPGGISQHGSGVWVRTFFRLVKPSGGGNTLHYSERKLLGYSADQMFEVVSRVEFYRDFVPWCTQSRVTARSPKALTAYMQVGFPPIVESYVSHVTMVRPTLVKSVCSDGRLFNHLETIWRFEPGLEDNPKTCTLDFKVSFEFRSRLHSHLAHMFLDEVVRQMTRAFLNRAATLYGKQSIPGRSGKVLPSGAP